MERAFQLGKAVKKPGKALKKRSLQGPEGPARKKKEAGQCRNIKEKLFWVLLIGMLSRAQRKHRLRQTSETSPNVDLPSPSKSG